MRIRGEVVVLLVTSYLERATAVTESQLETSNPSQRQSSKELDSSLFKVQGA